MPDIGGQAIGLAKDALASRGINLQARSAGSDDFETALSYGGTRFGGGKRLFVIEPSRWYQIFPYQIVVRITTPKGGPITQVAGSLFGAAGAAIGKLVEGNSTDYVFTLPIPPESISVSMVPASRVTAGLGGVVEETSETTFYQVQMAGTWAPEVGRGTLDKAATGPMRSTLSANGLISGAIQSLGDFIAPVGALADSLREGNLRDAASGLFDGTLPYSASAVKDRVQGAGRGESAQAANGYSNLLALQRFLHEYSALKEASPALCRLIFRNNKINQQYNCVVSAFSFQQSVSDPYSYTYNLALTCWGLQTPDAKALAIDRFGPGGDLQVTSPLSLTSALASARGTIKTLSGFARNPATVAGSIFRRPTV